MKKTAEHRRLEAHRERRANWKLWGPYLSDRAWGTVREDYSSEGDAWADFPHEHAASRAYRWNEDGLAGISDRNQHLCFALALWNGRDPILKERLFGLTGPQGNHGEDVKEYYFHLDNTPTHSYMKMLYRYPQAAFPYRELTEENARRGLEDPEYELEHTGVFEDDRYFDLYVEYAKAAEDDLLIRITVKNRGPDPARCHVLPTLWFRNTWSWGYPEGPMGEVPGRPSLQRGQNRNGWVRIEADHPALGSYRLHAEGSPRLLFTENETNTARLFGSPNGCPYLKDAFHRLLVEGETSAVNPAERGTKAAAHYALAMAPGASASVRLRLGRPRPSQPFHAFARIFNQRAAEADEFHVAVQRPDLTPDACRVQRQALAGLLWSKQLYYFDVEQWLHGDPAGPPPPPSRGQVRNGGWDHLHNFDVLSMPDKWEYPWYATWDLAFHCIPLALVDPDFAKRQLTLLTREWYMHPNGQLAASEWNFSDVNPPVHAWAAWRVYTIDAGLQGRTDRAFLEGIFHKLLLNFTWWINRKDHDGRNVFQGGFLAVGNAGVFDRGTALAAGGRLDPADGTAWMGAYCLALLRIALELAREDPVYQDTATKFFEHFLRIGHAMTGGVRRGHGPWDEEDGFYYDALHLPDDRVVPLRVRSMAGLLPLLAVDTLEPDLLASMPDFARRMEWFCANRPHLGGNPACVRSPGEGQRRLLALVPRDRLVRLLARMLDEEEFLSPYGLRSLSRYHAAHPCTFQVNGQARAIHYAPAESDGGPSGGNANARGPVWFPTNYLIIESLQRFHHYYGSSLEVECPTGSGRWMTLDAVATELSRRLIRIFLRDAQGRRPVFGGSTRFQEDPRWRDLVPFHEYFQGDNGAGLGASHQTGWTALVAELIQQAGG